MLDIRGSTIPRSKTVGGIRGVLPMAVASVPVVRSLAVFPGLDTSPRILARFGWISTHLSYSRTRGTRCMAPTSARPSASWRG